MFSCVWLHFKKCFGKYFLMFGCVLENTIENTFSTCCSHFLTFSQLPNEYIISFIPKNTNRTQKRSHFLGEIAIAISPISIVRSREASIAIAIDASREIDEIAIVISSISVARSRSTSIGTIPLITIAIDADRSLSLAQSVFCSRGFFLSMALSLFCAFFENHLKVKQQCKMISESTM